VRTERADAAAAGRTVFFSSHILAEVEEVSDRLGIMNGGRLVAEGTIEQLREELDVGASIRCEVADPPSKSALQSLGGVRSISAEEGIVDVKLADEETKVEVVKALDRETQVLDILSEDTSLEQLFNQYTNNGRTGERPPAEGGVDDREPEPAEVTR
jgi:ABC-2 type transport system ATP-binding protein